MKDVKYVCLQSDSAEKAIFNNTYNSPIISLKEFFKSFISENDYEIVRNEETVFTEKIKKYLSITIVHTLSPNALFSFKNSVEYMIRNYEYDRLVDSMISENQISLIKNQFLDKEFYKALLSENDFSISFLTAEWLYDSLKSAESIDLTSISMGYFKAIEQFLYTFISLHTKEKESTNHYNRKIYLFDKRLVPLDDHVFSVYKDLITIKTLISFLGYFDNNQNIIKKRNTDLLCPHIDKNITYEAIIKMFQSVTGDRNQFFHKQNITSWETINKERNIAYLFFFYFLGSYQFSDRDKIQFNIPLSNSTCNFNKLCAYTHYHSNSLYYIFFDDGRHFLCLAANDDHINYDKNGRASYSGFFLRKLSWGKCESFIIPVDKLRSIDGGELFEISGQELSKCVIYIGEMKPIPEGMLFDGPNNKIYDHGAFCAPVEKDCPSY